MPTSQYTRVGRALPTITNLGQLQQYMQNWNRTLSRTAARPVPAPPPQNFSATNARGGINLTWSPGSLVAPKSGKLSASGSPDGYEIVKSPSGNFKTDLTIIPIRDPAANQFFDSVGGAVQTVSYRIRTTAGTATSPYAQHGPESGAITHTSIDASDTTTVPTTKVDNYTTDAVRATASQGKYGAFLH
jgi:hypothetical protein